MRGHDHNPLLRGFQAPSAQHGVYRPEVGHHLTVALPSEKVRCRIQEVVTSDSVLAVIEGIVFLNKGVYAKGDCIPVRRGVEEGTGVEIWEVVSQRELQQRADNERFQAKERARVAQEENDRRQALVDAEEAEIERQKAKAPEAAPMTEAPRKVLGPRRSKLRKAR